MPTKINKSPLTVPAGVIVPLAKAGLGGLTSQISNVGTEFKQIRDEFKEKGFKEKKFGEKLKMNGGAYGRLLGTSVQSGLAGASKGLLGTDFGLSEKGLLADNQPGVEEEKPEYTTNIDPMTGQETPLTITGKPTIMKALTQMQGTTAHNMSAAQYKSALKMKEISGAATMPEKSDIKMEDLSGDGKVTMKDVLIGRGVIDKEGNKK